MAFDLHSRRSRADENFTTRCGRPEHPSWLDESLAGKATYIGRRFFLQSGHGDRADEAGEVIHEGILTKRADDDFVLHGRGGFRRARQLERGDHEASVAFVPPISIAGRTVRAFREGMSGEIGFELPETRKSTAEGHAAIPGHGLMGREAVLADKPGPRGADRGEADGRLMGVTTSRKYRYCFLRMPALRPIDVQQAGPATEVIVGRGNPGGAERRIRVTVAPAPCRAGHRRRGFGSAI
ncbi:MULTISPECIES: hypothetical protein [Streptomyces]|uniref:Uncharacterized protein n=1 Tax=Streptomyces sp. 900129855 TaxID=3155129 RepID=A0ABV2ZU22_9ACTN